MKTPTTLIIMDGFGLEGPSAGNAVVNAPTPNLDRIFRDFPGCRLSASGLDVGLPEGQMGNSEVGHTNMGAGRVAVSYTHLFQITVPASATAEQYSFTVSGPMSRPSQPSGI